MYSVLVHVRTDVRTVCTYLVEHRTLKAFQLLDRKGERTGADLDREGWVKEGLEIRIQPCVLIRWRTVIHTSLCTIQYKTWQHMAVQYSTALYSIQYTTSLLTIKCRTTHFNTPHLNTTQHNTTQHNTPQHIIAQHTTTPYYTTLHYASTHNTTPHHHTALQIAYFPPRGVMIPECGSRACICVSILCAVRMLPRTGGSGQRPRSSSQVSVRSIALTWRGEEDVKNER